MTKTRFIKTAAIVFLVCTATFLFGAAVIGWQDYQIITTPGSNPASGYLRIWADSGSGLIKCLTSAGATCYFNSSGGGSVTSVSATAPLTSSGGATPTISATYQGNGAKIQASTGSTTTDHCVKFDANGNTVDAGGTCTTGGATGTTIWSGTSNPNGLPTRFSPQNMTAASLPIPYVASASSTYQSNYPYCVFGALNTTPSGCTAHDWNANTGAPAQLEIDLGTGNTFLLTDYILAVAYVPQAPTAWTMQGSNDNSTWTTVDTQTFSGWVANTEYSYHLSSPGTTAYRYFRLNASACASCLNVRLTEMQLQNGTTFTSGTAGDFFYKTDTFQWFGPRTSGGSPTWPLQSLPQFAGVVSSVSTFTASGCSNSSLVGGATAGKYASGTTGTCTVVVTMGNSAASINGWACAANDLTTLADTIKQTATTTTTATLSGTTVSGDVVNFHCIGY